MLATACRRFSNSLFQFHPGETMSTKFDEYQMARKARETKKAQQKAENLALAKQAKKEGKKKIRPIKVLMVCGFSPDELDLD
jgi:hypothetical protein